MFLNSGSLVARGFYIAMQASHPATLLAAITVDMDTTSRQHAR